MTQPHDKCPDCGGWEHHDYPCPNPPEQEVKLTKTDGPVAYMQICTCGAINCEGRFDEVMRGFVDPIDQPELLKLHNSIVALSRQETERAVRECVEVVNSLTDLETVSGRMVKRKTVISALAKVADKYRIVII